MAKDQGIVQTNLRPRTPAWWRDAVLYTVFVDRYRRGAGGFLDRPREDDRAGGDLDGLRAALPHLSALGVTVLHLTPLCLSASAHRYDAVDPAAVDPALGGEVALADFLHEAHAAGLRVLLDLALTHVHRDHFAFSDVRARGFASPYAPWFRLRRFPFLEDVVKCFRSMDWGIDCFVHEGGHGQYEFDYGYFDALESADKWILIKEMLRQVAAAHDAFVTFMPKPFDDSMRSGAHYNMSLWNLERGENAFEDPEDPRGFGMSALAYSFVAGQLEHADAITAVTCPTVNSYRGLTDTSGVGGLADDNSWAPVGITYGVNNRSAMMRLPDGRSCVENRATDPGCNMYLGLAISLAAGLDGIERGLDPGDPVTETLYGMTAAERKAKGFRRLPSTLGEAIEAFDADPLSEATFGTELKEAYAKLKRGEWQEFLLHVPDWDRDRYLHLS